MFFGVSFFLWGMLAKRGCINNHYIITCPQGFKHKAHLDITFLLSVFFLSPMIIIYFISISPHGFATSFFGMFNHFIVFSSDILIANRLRRDIYYFIW